MNFCTECGKELSVYDVGLHKKIVNRGAVTFRCIECNAKHFGCSTDELWDKIALFRKQGCTLFPKED